MIDLAKVKGVAASAPDDLIFGCMVRMGPPRGAKSRGLQFFPGIRRPAQQFPSWWEISREDNGREGKGYSTLVHDWLRASSNYPTKYAIGAHVRPYLIASLGIRWGHSLMAFAQGSRAAGVLYATVNGYDEEENRPGSIEWARQAFIHDRVPYNLGNSSAEDYVESGIPLSHIDLFYIASDRTNAEFPRDLDLAAKTLSPRGIIVVDSAGTTQSVVNEWALANKRDCQSIDGLFILSS